MVVVEPIYGIMVVVEPIYGIIEEILITITTTSKLIKTIDDLESSQKTVGTGTQQESSQMNMGFWYHVVNLIKARISIIFQA